MRGARAWGSPAVLVVLAGLVWAGVALAYPRTQKPVTASLVDFKIKLSRSAVSPGTVVFRVSNNGSVEHNLVFAGAAGKRTRVLRPGQKQTLTVAFSKPGVYRFYCSVPGHRALGMQGTIRVGKVTTKPPAPSAGSPTRTHSDDLQLTQVASGFALVTDVLSPPGDAARLLVVQQNGLVSLVKDGVVQPAPFLDLRDRTRADGEKGLLALTFAPDYETSGLFYVASTTWRETFASSSSTARTAARTSPMPRT